MKTDRFNDSIRRKLERIRPDFTEKDWGRMQATLLQHATPPPSGPSSVFQPVTTSLWSARPWLMAAATVSAVVLVSFAAWQRAQINQLQQTVSQLNRQTVARPRQTTPGTIAANTVVQPSADPRQTGRPAETSPSPVSPSPGRVATTTRPDPMYVTRYGAVPAQPATTTRERTAQRSAVKANRSPSANPIDHLEQADRAPVIADAQPQQRQLAGTATTTLPNDARVDQVVSVDKKTTTQPTQSRLETTVAGRRKRVSSSSAGATAYPADGDSRVPAVSDGTINKTVRDGSGAVRPSATYDALATNRPMTMETIDWSKALAHRARQMRPVRTTTVGGEAAPASQPARQAAVGVRVGVGTEVSRNVLSGSVLTELLIGNHLTLGVGLGMGSFAGGTFLTDEQFDQHTHKPGKFRRDYIPGRGIDPRSDILNIGTHTERLLIPLTVGYRIPVSQSFSLLPSVGTTLNLQSKELVTFTFRQPLRSYETASNEYDRPVNLLNSLTFGAGIEWKRTHWVAQAGPVLTVPTRTDAHWQEDMSIGLRARVFYQF